MRQSEHVERRHHDQSARFAATAIALVAILLGAGRALRGSLRSLR